MGGVLPRILPDISFSSNRLDLTWLVGSIPSRTARRPTAARIFDHVGRVCGGFWKGVLHSFPGFGFDFMPQRSIWPAIIGSLWRSNSVLRGRD